MNRGISQIVFLQALHVRDRRYPSGLSLHVVERRLGAVKQQVDDVGEVEIKAETARHSVLI